jgi:small subunit ribosomal protein S7e
VRSLKKGSALQHPRTRTLTVVHDGILEDVVYPALQCAIYRLDGAIIMKVFCCFPVSSR